MKTSQAEWAHIRQQFIDRTARLGRKLSLRDRVWAVTPAGEWVALPGTSDSPVADRWWLGCDPEKLQTRHPLGVVLLCQARGGPLHAIGLPGSFLSELLPKLSTNQRQVFFNVVRRGGRFLLQLRGGEEIDVTERVEDVSWLPNGQRSEGVSRELLAPRRDELIPEPAKKETLDHDAGGRDELPAVSIRFFAVAKNRALHPMDDVALEPGSLYLVEVREAQVVPGNRSLRRILARGGPGDLPSDFAEQHDHYAHGAARR